MKRVFSLLVAMSIIAMDGAAAQEVTQSVSSTGYASTTFKTPADTTTKIVSVVTPSLTTRLKDGTKIEMDSDKSVYVIFADGARTTAPDGIHALESGQTIATKNGKLIP